MVAIPFVLLMGFIAFGVIKWGSAKGHHVVIGVLFGLLLAGTAAGPPIVGALVHTEEVFVSAIAQAAGGGQ
jgi:hypothetical protein